MSKKGRPLRMRFLVEVNTRRLDVDAGDIYGALKARRIEANVTLLEVEK